MAVPFLNRRKTQQEALIEEVTERVLSKALSPAVAQAAAAGVVGGNPSAPFTQTGGGLSSVPLPRTPEDFNSLFGPGTPFYPDALDQLGPNGRAQPRRMEYPVSWNIQLLDRAIPWTTLENAALNVDAVNRCIQLVQDGLVGREWSWGFSDSIIEQIMQDTGETNHARAMDLAKDKYGDNLARVKKFFERPDPRSDYTFSQWLSEMIWSHLVYDGVVIYPQMTYGGQLFSLSGIATSTIKKLLDNQGFSPEPPSPAYQQILYGFPRGEFQAGDGPVDGEYTSDQLSYYIRRPIPTRVYGYPQVEEVLPIAGTYMARQAWMAAEYSYGAMPKTYFELGENSTWTPEQVSYFEQILNDRLAGQIQRRQMGFLLPNGLKPTFTPQIDEKYKSDYDNWLLSQIASRFGVPAAQMGIQAKAGLSGGKQMEGESDQTEHFVFGAMISFFVDILNDLARRYLNVGDEITATCQDAGGSKEDIVQQATADKTVVGFGGMTINDYRAANGKPLYDMPEADEPMIITATGPVFLKGTLAVQDANTENTLNPPTPPTQVMVGPDGKPLPVQSGGTNGSDSNANGGRQSNDSGAAAGKKPATGNNGTNGAGGSTNQSGKTDSDGNSIVGDGTPSKGESSTTKELASFAKFAKSRIGRTWRDFAFVTIDGTRAVELNALGKSGDIDAIKAAAELPFAAGIVVKARDTQRVLLVQRSIDNQNETAAGLWEIPGGKLDDDDDAFKAAKREWEEETGIKLPDGDLFDSYTSQNGRYTTFIWMIDHETDIKLKNARGLDGSGDSEVENVAWWNINDLQNNSAVRAELQSIDWATLAHAKSRAEELNDAFAPVTAQLMNDDLTKAAEMVSARISLDLENLRASYRNLDRASRLAKDWTAWNEAHPYVPHPRGGAAVAVSPKGGVNSTAWNSIQADTVHESMQQQSDNLRTRTSTVDGHVDRQNNPRPGMGDIKMGPDRIAQLQTSTAGKYMDAHGNFTPERAAFHDQCVRDALKGTYPVNNPRFTMMGGGPASGKTTALMGSGRIDGSNAVHIDPDTIKGTIPEVKSMMAAGDLRWANMSHEESSYMAERVRSAATEGQRNIILDTTGDSSAEKLGAKIDQARANGYTVHGEYVTMNVDKALAGSIARAAKTGRVVDEPVARGIYTALTTTVPASIGKFDTFRMYDNNTSALQLIASKEAGGELVVHDQAAYQAFLNNKG